jgi:hypothetical protein
MSLAVKRKLGPDLEVAARRLVLAARVPASTTGPTECLPLPVNVVASAVAVEVTVVDRVAVPVAVLARSCRPSRDAQAW